MKRFAIALIFLLTGCAGSPQIGANSGDLVAWGTLKNHSFKVLDEWGLNGRATADFHITRVVTGRTRSKVVRISYIAHSYIHEGVEMRLRLKRSGSGEYLVCSEGGRGYVCD